jgi:4-amino-4-deoxy-L-arabinose transferase-like glycosyltransferase
VTQTDQPSLNSQSPSLAARLAWLLLILATLYICYFHNLGAIGLVGPDEPRYAWIARDMMETGDWVTPRLYGKPWFEKPPLFYWGAALSFTLLGVSEAAARLPSAISALLATLAMAWLALRLYGAETARWLFVLLPTTVGMIGFSHAAATDMPFAGMLTIAMVCAAVILGLTRNEDTPVLPRTPWLALLLFGSFLGFAVLAKGPAAIVLSGGAVLLWAVFTKRWQDALRCLHPVAIGSFCLTALPWYILCARRNPDFFRVFIIEHNFKRYLTPEFQHIQPFWFYVPVLLIAFLPWTLALVWCGLSGFLRYWPSKRPSDFTIFVLCWVLFGLLFFSLSKSKLPGYILPLVPAIGLLLTATYVRQVDEKKSFRWLLWGGGIISILTAAALWSLRFGVERFTARAAHAAGWVLFGIAAANLLLSVRVPRLRSRFTVSTLGVAPLLLLLCFFPRLGTAFLPGDPSGRTISIELGRYGIPPAQLYVGPMSRGQQFSLSFYLHHEVETWVEDSPKEGYLLLRLRVCSHYVKPPWMCGSPIELQDSGYFLYHVRSMLLPAGLGTLGGNDNLGDRDGRQSR